MHMTKLVLLVDLESGNALPEPWPAEGHVFRGVRHPPTRHRRQAKLLG